MRYEQEKETAYFSVPFFLTMYNLSYFMQAKVVCRVSYTWNNLCFVCVYWWKNRREKGRRRDRLQRKRESWSFYFQAKQKIEDHSRTFNGAIESINKFRWPLSLSPPPPCLHFSSCSRILFWFSWFNRTLWNDAYGSVRACPLCVPLYNSKIPSLGLLRYTRPTGLTTCTTRSPRNRRQRGYIQQKAKTKKSGLTVILN